MRHQTAKRVIDTSYLLVLGLILLHLIWLFVGAWNSHSLLIQKGPVPQISDFVTFYATGVLVDSADARRAYDPAVQLKYFNQLIAPLHLDKPLYFYYPPYVFCIVGLLAHLPIEAAFAVWVSIGLAAAATMLFVLLRCRRSLSLLFCLAVELCVAASYPVVPALTMGQSTWIMLAFVCAFFYALWKKRDILGGMALSGIAIKPHYAVFFAVAALAQRRWRLLGVALISLVVLLIWSACVLGIGNVIAWPLTVIQTEPSSIIVGVRPEKMICVRGLALYLLPHAWQLPVALLSMVGAVIYCYWIWQRSTPTVNENEKTLFRLMTATCLLALSFSPHTHVYDLLLLAPMALTLERTSLTDALSQGSISERFWSALIMLYPLWVWLIMCLVPFTPIQPFLTIFALNLFLLGMLALKLSPSKSA